MRKIRLCAVLLTVPLVTVACYNRRPPPSSEGEGEVDAGCQQLSGHCGNEGEGETGGEGEGEGHKQDGPPGNQTNRFPHGRGDAASGKIVFRSETFGNENFWTDAAQLPQGIVAAGLTPVQALKVGLNVNIDALDAATVAAVGPELATDLSPAKAPILNNPATTIALINANAVIGVVAVDSNCDGKIDVLNGDKVGVSCALCHAVTDRSVFSVQNGGSIGKEIDGPTPHTLNVGAIFATAGNTRALYPLAQLALRANNRATIGRAPEGLTENSTEAEFDAYFSNPAFYPIGMFDDQPDGTGAPMHITPMFRADLSAPYGSEGAIAKLDNFSNLVYTVLFDPRGLITDGGKAFLHTLAGAAGDEIASNYELVLNDTKVPTAYGIRVEQTGTPGAESTPIGVRVDNAKLLDMSAYMDDLQAPKGAVGDIAAVERGREQFRSSCTDCHNVDQSRFVPQMIVPMKEIFPGDNPVILAQRTPPLNPIQNTVDNIFDDKMVVVNASIRGDIRGIALPLLLDLARKPVFLHDNSVPSLDGLFDANRGDKAPHPFYIKDLKERSDMIIFLKSLEASPRISQFE